MIYGLLRPGIVRAITTNDDEALEFIKLVATERYGISPQVINNLIQDVKDDSGQDMSKIVNEITNSRESYKLTLNNQINKILDFLLELHDDTLNREDVLNTRSKGHKASSYYGWDDDSRPLSDQYRALKKDLEEYAADYIKRWQALDRYHRAIIAYVPPANMTSKERRAIKANKVR